MKRIITILTILLSAISMNAQTTDNGLRQHAEQPYLTLNNGVRMPQIATLNQHDTGTIDFGDPQFVKYLIENYG